MHDDQLDSIRYVFLSQEQYDSLHSKEENKTDNINKNINNKEEDANNERI